MIKGLFAVGTALIFSAIPYGIIHAADVPNLDACPGAGGLTTDGVKYIGEADFGSLFLDENGRRVVPCRGADGVRFFIMYDFEKGKELYNESKNGVMNRDFFDSVINVGFGEITSLTFGDGHEKVSDLYEYQKKKEIARITGKEELRNIELPPYMASYFILKPEWFDDLPDKFRTLTPKEKDVLLKNDYAEIEKYASSYNAKGDIKEAEEYAVKNNRHIMPSKWVINQFPYDESLEIDKKDDSMTAGGIEPSYGEIDGTLYLLYEAATAQERFMHLVPDAVLKFLLSDSYTQDQKLAVTHHIAKEQTVLDSYAVEYRNALKAKMAGLPLDKQEALGGENYSKLSKEEKNVFSKFIGNVNRGIIKAEFDDLPDEISGKQYDSLSDIDKYKYQKKRDGKKRVTKGRYVKNSVQVASKYSI